MTDEEKELSQESPAALVDRRVGARLRARRLNVGVDPIAVSNVLGVAEADYLAWESGLKRVPAQLLIEVAQLLGCDASDFFAGLDDNLSRNQ